MPSGTAARTGVSLLWKIFIGIAGAVILALAAVMFLSYTSALRATRAAVESDLDQATQITNAILDGRQQALARSARTFAENPRFRDLVLHAKPGSVIDQAVEAQDRIGASWVQITDSAGMRLARSDQPSAPSVSLASSPLVRKALDGEKAIGYGLSSDTTIFQAVAVPIAAPGSNPVGALMAASEVDDQLAQSVEKLSGVDVIFYAGDTAGGIRIAATTMPRSAELAAAASAYIAKHISTDAPLEQRVVTVRGEEFVGRVEPLRSAGGKVLGGFLSMHVRAMKLQTFKDLKQELWEAGVIGLLIAFLLSFLVARGVTRPLESLLAATRRAAAGDYSPPDEIKSNDEIGELGAALGILLKELRDQQALVQILKTSGERSAVSRESAIAAATQLRTVTTARSMGPGSIFASRYQITGTLGAGGMGVVYKATDSELGEPVAIKTLRSDFLSNDPTALQRFRSEIKLARKISSRNIVKTYDIGESDGVHYLTMEYVNGTSLQDLLLKRKKMPGSAVISIGKQLARALQAAHEEGVIHRDIKPQNILVQPDGVLKVMDFGIARLTERPKGMTKTGMVVGTPEYMSPEQLLGDDIDPRSDLYSAGIVLYECATGARPWAADSATVLIGKMLSEPPIPPNEVDPEVPAALSALILRTIARDREERPATAAALADELDTMG
jgi:serine/threonine-protein kinase